VQMLFDVARVTPDEVLCGYLVPFRTTNAREISANALDFGIDLWRTLLGSRRPQLTFAMGRQVFDALCTLFDSTREGMISSGWGQTWIRQASYDGGRLIGLPHLSRYKIFGHPHSDGDGAEFMCDEVVRHVIWD
jgi:hypothetical protein